MKAEWLIAIRYLRTKKHRNAINVMTGVSVAAVAVVTAAMLCVLSVMNGFGVVVAEMFSNLDAELRITAKQGKVLDLNDERILQVITLPQIEIAAPTIEETAMVEFRGKQTPAILKGVDSTYQQLTNIDSIIIDGAYAVWDGAFERTVVGVGLANTLGVGAHFITGIHIYAPTRTQTVNLLRPDKSIHQAAVFISAIFAVNQAKYDNEYMLISLPLARQLFEYSYNQATALEIKLKPNASLPRIERQIQDILGGDYVVANRYEQQADFYKVQQMEKWLTWLLMIFILLIAGFNIIGSLTMLILDKRDDADILRAMGADEQMLRRIFRYEGWLISAIGAIVGIILGLIICLGQQHFGWLKMGNGYNYVLSAYPVAVEWTDVVAVIGIVALIGYIAAWIPTKNITHISNLKKD